MNYSIYTPEKYAIDMVEIALNRYFEKNDMKKNIMKLKVIDISCGSGNLILVVLEKLLQKTKQIYGEYRYSSEWITGFDINIDALNILEKKIYELSLKYEIDIKNINLEYCDALYKDINEKYDIVIGNPPYLGEKNHKDVFQNIKKTEFGKKYYSSKMDYFYFFIEKGIEILKSEGILVYLTTNYWLKADSAKKLRKSLKSRGSFFQIDNYNCSIFINALGQHNIIFCWEKDVKNSEVVINENNQTYELKQKNLYDKDKIILIKPQIKKYIDNIKRNSNTTLGELLNINQGIVSGNDKVFVFKEKKSEFKDYLKPFYKNKDIGKYNVAKKPNFWILYAKNTVQFPEHILEFLEQFKTKLSTRREVVREKIKWWELQWARDEKIFTTPKIVVRQRCKTNNFAYTENDFYGSADIYFLTPKYKEIELFYILGYLNSELFFLWFSYMGKRKGDNLEFYSTPLKETPIYYPKNRQKMEYVIKLVKKQLICYSDETQMKIDNYFYTLMKIERKKILEK